MSRGRVRGMAPRTPLGRPAPSTIPPAVLERGEQAVVNVLRRRYPDASFVVREIDGRSICPDDRDVADEVGARAAANVHSIQEAGEHLAPLGGVEAGPQVDESSANGKSRHAA